jgi:hypothetical protein
MNIPRPARGRKRVRNTVDGGRSWGYPQKVSAPLSPLLALLSAGLAFAGDAPAAAADPSQDIALHCRPEVLAAFADMFAEMKGYKEEALTIAREGEALRIARSTPRAEELCQSVLVDGQTAAIAHTHADRDDAVQIPVGPDCDTAQPNYVVTREAVYVTVVKEPGARRFRDTGDRDDLGRYRQVLGSEWRRRERWSDPQWQRSCAERALESRGSRAARVCHFDADQSRRYRRAGAGGAGGGPAPCAERPGPR